MEQASVDTQQANPPTMKFTWTIENFTRLNTKKHYSDMFVVGGDKWRILIFPKGNNVDCLSMYLDVADSQTLPYGWSRYAHFSLAVVNQIHTKYSIRKDTEHQFNARQSDWGFTSFMPLGDLYDPSRGYLVNDTVLIESEVAVRKIRLKKEQEEEEDKRRYKAQPHLYTIIKVARDEDLAEQIGRHIYVDLVDHDKVRSFCIQKQTPFNLFKEEVAKEFGIPVQFQRFWIWAERKNHTYRPYRPLTPQAELQSVGKLREVSNKPDNGELKLFLEVEFGPDLHPLPPPDKSREDILLFFKVYEPAKQELRFVGRLFVKSSTKPAEILSKLNQLAGFYLDQEIELFEEIKFEPCIMCEHLDKETSFRLSQIEDGDIICFQKSTPLSSEEECKYPDVPSFLEYVHNRQVVHFRSLEKPKEEDFSLELSKLHTYDDVTEKVAQQIGLDDSTKIRLTAHNCYSQQPEPQPIKFRGVKHLSDMLVHCDQSSDILYYEVLDIPLPQLQALKNLKVAFHHSTKDKATMLPEANLDAKSALQDEMLSQLYKMKSKVETRKDASQVPMPSVQDGGCSDVTLRRLSATEELLKSTSEIPPSAEALAALDTVKRIAGSSLATLCIDGSYEEFTAGLTLLTEKGVIPSKIASMLKNLLESLEGEIPKYLAAEKEIDQDGKEIAAQHEEIKIQVEMGMQKCHGIKDSLANYDAKVAELEAELVVVKAKRAETMANLKTAVDEMEPLRQRFADSSSRSESFTVRQAMYGASNGTWRTVQDVLKNFLKF